jgi:hypothetical protein
MGLGKPGRSRVDQPTITGELGPAPDAYTHYSPVMIAALSKQAGVLLMEGGPFFAPSRRPADIKKNPARAPPEKGSARAGLK